MTTHGAAPALLIRLRPTGPWRIAGDSGRKDDLNPIFPSDRVYSAVAQALASTGEREAFFAATATAAAPAFRFSSLFPFYGKQLYAPPPVTVWPPERASSKLNWQAAKLVPLAVIDELLAGEALREDRWEVDGLSGCLLPAGSQSPFRERLRYTAPVDRLTGASAEAHADGCLEFNQGVGLWMVVLFASAEAQARWTDPLKTAFRLLADSGLGGERSRGWGRSAPPEFQNGSWPSLLLDHAAAPDGESGYWLLSHYVPAATDSVQLDQGFYELRERRGRVESPEDWGAPKQVLRMIAEGGVLVAAAEPTGRAVDVAPAGFSHPVWRAGFSVAVPVKWKAPSFQLPPMPAKAEPIRMAPAESAAPLADIYLTDPIIVGEAIIVEEANIVEQPRYVEDAD
jgi:CRISPR type III-A-associated RAMP protein Csm4